MIKIYELVCLLSQFEIFHVTTLFSSFVTQDVSFLLCKYRLCAEKPVFACLTFAKLIKNTSVSSICVYFVRTYAIVTGSQLARLY